MAQPVAQTDQGLLVGREEGGASAGDLLSQPPSAGGLGLGTTWTSLAFLVVIAALVIVMSIQRRRETLARGLSAQI